MIFSSTAESSLLRDHPKRKSLTFVSTASTRITGKGSMFIGLCLFGPLSKVIPRRCNRISYGSTRKRAAGSQERAVQGRDCEGEIATGVLTGESREPRTGRDCAGKLCRLHRHGKFCGLYRRESVAASTCPAGVTVHGPPGDWSAFRLIRVVLAVMRRAENADLSP
jgi:hypothetical protein